MRKASKIASLLLSFIILCSVSSTALAASPVYTLTVTVIPTLISNDHVGNEWDSYAKIGGKLLGAGETQTYTVKSTGSLSVSCVAIEEDKIPDKGSATITVKAKSLKMGTNTITKTVTVKENRGRYSGHKATWSFVITVIKTQQK